MSITFSLLAILLTIAVMLHVTEEFLFPGGFPEWYARLVPPKTANKSTTGFLVWINTLMMCANAFALYFGDSLHGYSIWYYNAAPLFTPQPFDELAGWYDINDKGSAVGSLDGAMLFQNGAIENLSTLPGAGEFNSSVWY